MKNRRILTSIALSATLATSASAWDMLIADRIETLNKTGLWFRHGTGGDFRNAFSTNEREGGFEGFFTYREKDNGFALGPTYPTLNALKIYLRPILLTDITEKDKPVGDAGGVASKEYNSMRIDNQTRTGYISLGRYNKDWHNPVVEQSPVLWVAPEQTLVLGDVNNYSQGLTINYNRILTTQDWVEGTHTLDTIAKFEIRGNFVGNIKTEHQDGPASNTTDGMGYESETSPYKRVPLVTWGNVLGTISSTMTFDTKTAEITMPAFEGQYNEIVDYYSVNYTQKNHLMNRWVITGAFASRKDQNPLRFISKDYSSTYLEFGGSYTGGDGLVIASEGSTTPDGKRRTATFVNALNHVEIGEIYALNQGSVYLDLKKGAKIGAIGFGSEYFNNNLELGYGVKGGLVNFNVKSGTLSIEKHVLTDAGPEGDRFYDGRHVALFDTSGVNGGVTFDIKSEMKNASWTISVAKDTKVKLGGQYNYINKLDENGGVSMLHKAQNVNIEIDRNQTKQSLIWIGDRETENKKINELIGLRDKVVNGGLTIETNINKLSDGKYTPDLVVVRNMIINRSPENGKTINVIPRTKSTQDFKDHVGKVVGYTTSGKYGTVDFTKNLTWKPTDGILKGHFNIELSSMPHGFGNEYKEWKIAKYDYVGDDVKPPVVDPDPKPPVKPDPVPEKDPSFGGFDDQPDIGFDPGLTPDLDKPVTPPEPEKPDPNPDPNPNPTPDPDPEKPNPPVEPDQPVQPDKPVTPPKPPVDGGDQKPPVIDPNPPVDKPEEKPEEKPDQPIVNDKPFTETFVRSMEKSTQETKNLYLAIFNSMNKRLGELRDSYNVHGVWGRVFAGAYNQDIFWSLQAGYDNLIVAKPNLNLFVGGAVSYAKDEYTDLGEFVAYASMVQDNGFYNDTLLKFAIMNSKTELSNIMHYGVTVSDEVGYRFRFGEFFIDPQVEMSLGYLTGGSYDSVYNGSQVNVQFGDTVHFRARYGVNAGYDYIHKDKIKIQAYLGLYGESDKFTKASGNGSTLGAYGMRQEFAGGYTTDNRLVLNLGTNIDMRDAGKVYFDFEKSFLGDFVIDWKVNIGFRYNFGEKVKLQPRTVTGDVAKKDKEKEEVTPVALKSKSNKAEKVTIEKSKVAKNDVKKSNKASNKKTAKASTKKSVKTAKASKTKTKKENRTVLSKK